MKNVRVKNILLLLLAFAASAVMLTVIQAPLGVLGVALNLFGWRIEPQLSWLAWVSLVPFILACSPDAKPRRLALVCYTISLCYWLGNLYWICPITVLGWIAFCLYTALLWPVLALCLRYCRIKKIPLFLAAPILVVGAERLQGLFLGGFFWRFLAHSQYQNITLIQTADIFGAGGVSFLIAMVNGLAAELILDARFWRSVLRISNLLKIGLVGTALVAAIVYGRWRINQSDVFVTAGPLVASLQSNVPQSVKREALRGEGEHAEKTSEAIFDELMQASYASVEAGAELIVWPETMVQATLNPEVLELVGPAHTWKSFDQALREHSKDTAFLLVGAYGGMPDKSKTRLVERYNSAFLYKPDGQQYEEHYDKIHLVLFGEVLPFRKSFPLLFKLIMKFNPYGYDHSLDAGSRYSVFEMAGGQQDYKFSVMICYEATIPAIARRFALDQQGRKQIHWLVNISNDGWFVRFKDGKVLPSTELPQHAAICAFRAVENRLAVLRSVNTGISCLIDSLGRVKNGFLAGTLPRKAMARTGMAGWFTDRIPIDKRTTLFSKYGQWLDFCCEFCLIVLIIVPLSARLFKIKKCRIHLSGKPNEKYTPES